MTVKIHVVEPAALDLVWDVASPLIEKSIETDFVGDIEYFKETLDNDEAVLILATVDGKLSGAVVVTVYNVGEDVVNIIALGGENIKAWQHDMNETITKYAKVMGCTHVVALGRKAWKKIWPEFKEFKMMYYKKVA